MPPQQGHEHLVATFGPLDEHRRDDRHHHAEKGLAADAFADIGQAQRAVVTQRGVVRTEQRVVVVAADVVGQCAAKEVRDVDQRRPPRDGLPVHDGQRAVGALLPEQHVVQPVVAMDEPVHGLGEVGLVGVEARDHPLTHLAVLRRNLIPVTIQKPGVQLGDERLVHRRFPVEPVDVGHRGKAEQRRVQPAELGHRQQCLFAGGAADLVTHDGGRGVAEQEVEHPGLGVEPEAVTGRDRPADPRRDVGVEPNLAFVEAQRQARLPARRVGGRDLQDHRRRAGAAVAVAQGDAVTLTHLAGADALDAELLDRARPDRGRQPPGGQVVRPLDVSVRHLCCPYGRCQVGFRRRRAPGCGRRSRTA